MTASPTLTEEEWTRLNNGMSELGKYVADTHGAMLVFLNVVTRYVFNHSIIWVEELTQYEMIRPLKLK